MQLGMVGLGRMGGDMVRRLLSDGHECVVFDRADEAVSALVEEGAHGVASFQELVEALDPPRAVWLMLPAAAVDGAVDDLLPLLEPDDIVVDGGNSYYVDDLRRARRAGDRDVHWLDVGTSGGVRGLERGYCLMIGGAPEPVARLDPAFRTLAPGRGDLPATPGRDGREGTAEEGYLHCGPVGSGHFVKMVHNGIEYGIMAAYAEGMGVLAAADVGAGETVADAETAPLRHPDRYRFDLDLADIAEVWRRGSVISSWLLDLTAAALAEDPGLERFEGRVSDSGEGRWTVKAAVDQGVPTPVLSAALFTRFASRGRGDLGNRVLSAMRYQFGGHEEKDGEG